METIDVKKCICLNAICNDNDNDLINNENISNAHNAKFDVINLQKTIKKLFEMGKFKKNISLNVIT
jgi:hypothetical protein